MKCNKRIKTQSSPCYYYIKPEDGEVGFCKLPQYFRCIEAIEAKMMRLSYSQAMSWIRCPFAYYLYSIRGIKQKKIYGSTPLKLGTIWDKIMNDTFMAGGPINEVAALSKLEKLSAELLLENRDQYKLRAIIRAISTFGITFPKCEPQYEIRVAFKESVNLLGYLDAKSGDAFFELKLTGNPSWYEKIWNIHDQIGTYFLGDEALQRCIMLITRVPDLRTLKRNSEETDEEYGDRCYNDILSRPSNYFPGWNKDRRTWGRVYYRNEFDFPSLERLYRYIGDDIRTAARRGVFFQRHGSCLSPFECEFFPLCETRQDMNEEMYEYREDEKKIDDGIEVEE